MKTWTPKEDMMWFFYDVFFFLPNTEDFELDIKPNGIATKHHK